VFGIFLRYRAGTPVAKEPISRARGGPSSPTQVPKEQRDLREKKRAGGLMGTT